MNSSGKNSSSDIFSIFMHELKRQKKKSNDQQKWMGKSVMSVVTAYQMITM